MSKKSKTMPIAGCSGKLRNLSYRQKSTVRSAFQSSSTLFYIIWTTQVDQKMKQTQHWISINLETIIKYVYLLNTFGFVHCFSHAASMLNFMSDEKPY